MDAIDTIRRIAGASAEDLGPLESWGAPSHVLSGRPVVSGINIYTSFNGAFSAGIWQCTPGRWRVTYAQDELCIMLSGRLVITDSDGKSRRFAAGDTFVIPAGFHGIWEVLETVRRVFAVHQTRAA